MKKYKWICSPGACGLIGMVVFVLLFNQALGCSFQSLFHQSLGGWLGLAVIGLPGAAIGALVGSFLKKIVSKEEQSSQILTGQAQPANNTESTTDQLLNLKKLLDAGAISQEEFDIQKNKIMNS